jgi:hypothetical protein
VPVRGVRGTEAGDRRLMSEAECPVFAHVGL